MAVNFYSILSLFFLILVQSNRLFIIQFDSFFNIMDSRIQITAINLTLFYSNQSMKTVRSFHLFKLSIGYDNGKLFYLPFVFDDFVRANLWLSFEDIHTQDDLFCFVYSGSLLTFKNMLSFSLPNLTSLTKGFSSFLG